MNSFCVVFVVLREQGIITRSQSPPPSLSLSLLLSPYLLNPYLLHTFTKMHWQVVHNNTQAYWCRTLQKHSVAAQLTIIKYHSPFVLLYKLDSWFTTQCILQQARARQERERREREKERERRDILTARRLCVPALIDGATVSSTKAFTFDISTKVSQVLSCLW